MQRETQSHFEEKQSPLSVLRRHFDAWRKANNWSRETAAQMVVEAHEALGFDTGTEVQFEPKSQDAFTRQRVNADRLYRWLDDVSKDRNLIPYNVHVSVLKALPMERRIACMNEIYAAIDVFATGAVAQEGEAELDVRNELPAVMKETNEALHSLVMINAEMSDKHLSHGHQEIGEAIHHLTRIQRLIEKTKSVRQKLGAKVGAVVHKFAGHK